MNRPIPERFAGNRLIPIFKARLDAVKTKRKEKEGAR